MPGGEGITVCLRLSGGENCKVEAPFIVFRNPSGNYPIESLDVNVEGICYRSQRRGWMTQHLFSEYFAEPRVIQPLPNGEIRQLWVGSCALHNHTPMLEATTSAISTSIQRFPANCTDKIQPLDQLVFRSFKSVWKKKWNDKRVELIRIYQVTSTGRFQNPRKRFYLELTKAVADEVNEKRTSEGLSYVRKSMIMWGLILSLMEYGEYPN